MVNLQGSAGNSFAHNEFIKTVLTNLEGFKNYDGTNLHIIVAAEAGELSGEHSPETQALRICKKRQMISTIYVAANNPPRADRLAT